MGNSMARELCADCRAQPLNPHVPCAWQNPPLHHRKRAAAERRARAQRARLALRASPQGRAEALAAALARNVVRLSRKVSRADIDARCALQQSRALQQLLRSMRKES